MKFTPLLTLAVLVTGLTVAAAQNNPVASGAPKLVVVLVVDQMRADYLERFGSHFSAGLKRLRDEGTWFRRAAYPYLNTVTCAGHSTIGTGALPYRHGMVLNRWWERAEGRTRACTDDATAKNIGHAQPSSGHDSAAALLVPTLSEQLRRTTGGQSVVVSLKPRSAIGLAGRGESAVLWQEGSNMVTSTAFARGPIDWVTSFVTANPPLADRGKTWERMLPLAAYVGEDNVPEERFPTGWTATFPHPVGVPEGQMDPQWQRTPLADEYLARMAVHALETLNLGRGRGTDFLGVSFSTLDLVGHQFGPDSHEVQDVLFRLDATLGRLLATLDAKLGKGGYVLALSADHGVSAMIGRTGGGRHLSAEITATIDKALSPVFGNGKGDGKYVAHAEYTDIYFAAGIAERFKATPQAWTAVRDALQALPGIGHVFRAEELSSAEARASADPTIRAAALSFNPARSGDVIVVPKENWLLSSAAATHGTLYSYDQRVPVLFFGAGVKASVTDAPATPADIAPTLASLAGAAFEATDGKALLTAETVRDSRDK